MAGRVCSLESASTCYEGIVHVIIASVLVFSLPVFQPMVAGIESVLNKGCFEYDRYTLLYIHI